MSLADKVTAALYLLVLVVAAAIALTAWTANRANAADAKRLADLERDAELWAPGRDANKAAFDSKGATR